MVWWAQEKLFILAMRITIVSTSFPLKCLPGSLAFEWNSSCENTVSFAFTTHHGKYEAKYFFFLLLLRLYPSVPFIIYVGYMEACRVVLVVTSVTCAFATPWESWRMSHLLESTRTWQNLFYRRCIKMILSQLSLQKVAHAIFFFFGMKDGMDAVKQ